MVNDLAKSVNIPKSEEEEENEELFAKVKLNLVPTKAHVGADLKT